MSTTPTDIVVVHQHLPTAALLAGMVKQPVIFFNHNFERLRANTIAHQIHMAKYKFISGVAMVSNKCLQKFRHDYPELTLPSIVIPNGLDTEAWSGDAKKENVILVVGRAAPDKGILEALEAIEIVLSEEPDWRAEVILSELNAFPNYKSALFAIAGRNVERIRIRENLQHEEVHEVTKRAAIAVVLSKNEEPFGRTALEAHLCGAALISSGTGGLREVSGDHAIYVGTKDPQAVKRNLRYLIKNEAARLRLASEARIYVESRYDIKQISKQFDDFCSKFL